MEKLKKIAGARKRDRSQLGTYRQLPRRSEITVSAIDFSDVWMFVAYVFLIGHGCSEYGVMEMVDSLITLHF